MPPEITFTPGIVTAQREFSIGVNVFFLHPAMAMSSSSFGGVRPSGATPDENIYEEPQRRRDSEEWRRPGEQFASMYIGHCILYIVYCILYIVHFILNIVHCTLCIVHCTLYIVYCTLYIVHFILNIVY